ncbi:MAG: cyclic nucleotide-binding domain-containing protein [Desulfobacterales bacterium]|nr:MAG: cyclic nucleotide-binding domain-containing protein [Desulfobacterales bacterium]
MSGLPLFSMLPKKEVAFAAGEMSEIKYPKTTVLSVQGRTKLDCVYIIKEGTMELFYETDGEKQIKGTLETGETFGGVSILMNAGISVRTVQVVNDATLYVFPQKAFLEICTRNKNFYEHFAGRFRAEMTNDSYASIVAVGQALHFLSRLVPFSFLPEEEISRIAAAISIINYPKDTLLFVQGQSKIQYLYIIKKGAAERYYEENNKKTLRGILSEGDSYGGISMLMNNGISIRTLRVTEDSYFYILPKELFLEICKKYEAFSDFYTDTFGKRMLDRSYAEIIAGNLRPAEIAPEFFNQPIESIVNKELVYCDQEMPIQAAAAVMSGHNASSIFICDANGEFVGVVTDNDLRKKVTATGYDILKPVYEIMSSPLVTISSNALVFETMMLMMQKNIKHLAIRDSTDKVVGVITNRDLLKAQGQSPFFIMREIAQARFINQVFEVHRHIPQMLQSLINTGAKAQNITRFLTTVSDAVLQKIIAFALVEMGPPPARFVFMVLGSEGRKEQTLKTDQDNAIIFEDLPAKAGKAAMNYFLNFAEKVCGWLDEAGYSFCKGGVMAKNPKWCQPLQTWKRYFTDWIHTAAPEALLQASIFFDFRAGYGDTGLVDELRSHLFDSLVGWPGFFRHLAENALFFTPPIGFFRNFLVESKGEHRDSFDIKAAMQPVVDYARIYALNHRIEETNTLGRLNELLRQEEISAQQYNELDTVYSYLMQQRFVRQVRAVIEEKAEPDNYINPKKLSRIEQTTLKEIFKRIEKFQSKLSFDFTGMT